MAAAVVYNALFVWLSTATSRALIAGLGYVVIWEGVLANLVGGARILSVSHYGLAVASSIAPGPRCGRASAWSRRACWARSSSP